MPDHRVGPQTKRLIHRELTVDDAEAFYALNSNPQVMRLTGEDPVASVERKWACIGRENCSSMVCLRCGTRLRKPPAGCSEIGLGDIFRVNAKCANQVTSQKAGFTMTIRSVRHFPGRISHHGKFLAVLVTLIAWPLAATAALHTVTYSNTIDPPTVVCDGDAADLDPDVGEIEVHYSLADPIADDWVATGTILATTTNPAGATLVVTDTTIRNVTGNQVLAAQILVEHDFLPLVSFTQQYVGHIDGSFDKVGGGILGNLILNWTATITGNTIANQGFPGGLVPAPVFFDWTGGPFHEDTVTRQTQEFIFYIDELDNTINFYDSATILPTEAPVLAEDASWGAIKGLFR